jgi:hypothetical protein
VIRGNEEKEKPQTLDYGESSSKSKVITKDIKWFINSSLK